MEKIDIVTNVIKTLFINICIFYISFKITNYKPNNWSKIALLSIVALLISIEYVLLSSYINAAICLIILYILYSIIFAYITGNKLTNSIIVTALSVSIGYISYIISVMCAGVIIYLTKISNSYSDKFNFLFIVSIEVLMLFLLFKNKRFKNGFNFTKKDSKSIDIISYSLLFFMIIITLFNLIDIYINDTANAMLFTSIIIVAVSLIIWLRVQITKQYKRNMRDRTIEIQKLEIDEQLNIINEIKEENFRLAKVIHKYNNRLCALELGLKNLLNENIKKEFAKELSCILEDTEYISSGFSDETTINNKKLPLTNINGIDNMFKYMQSEANKNNINYSLTINNSINDLIDKIINKDKLETLIGDHLKDAIIAVNKGNTTNKSIQIVLGIIEGCYELSIYDTGVEFNIDALLRLGLEPITTNKEIGGSGIGFMTTFETLKECNASLIIEEYNPKDTNYTKAVIIRFDGKNEYKICSYRANKIRENNKNNRIIIKDL